MEILYESKKLEKLVNNKAKLAKEHGVIFAKAFYKRLDQLKALKLLFNLMGSGLDHPHLLKGDFANCIGWDIDANKRIILKIPPTMSTFDAMQSEQIILKGVVDYHGDKTNWYLT